MEKFYMNYSQKNAPIPSKEHLISKHLMSKHLIHLISKVERFIKRMRWKTLQFLEKLESTNKTPLVSAQENVHLLLRNLPILRKT